MQLNFACNVPFTFQLILLCRAPHKILLSVIMTTSNCNSNWQQRLESTPKCHQVGCPGDFDFEFWCFAYLANTLPWLVAKTVSLLPPTTWKPALLLDFGFGQHSAPTNTGIQCGYTWSPTTSTPAATHTDADIITIETHRRTEGLYSRHYGLDMDGGLDGLVRDGTETRGEPSRAGDLGSRPVNRQENKLNKIIVNTSRWFIVKSRMSNDRIFGYACCFIRREGRSVPLSHFTLLGSLAIGPQYNFCCLTPFFFCSVFSFWYLDVYFFFFAFFQPGYCSFSYRYVSRWFCLHFTGLVLSIVALNGIEWVEHFGVFSRCRLGTSKNSATFDSRPKLKLSHGIWDLGSESRELGVGGLESWANNKTWWWATRWAMDDGRWWRGSFLVI